MGFTVRPGRKSLAWTLYWVIHAAGCAPLIDKPDQPLIVVETRDMGATVDLGLAQQLQVRLDGNRTTGFQWLLIDQTGGILETIGEAPRYEPSAESAGLLGGGGTENWLFRPARRGEGLLRFEYRRPWENGREALRSAVFKVRVR